MGKRGPNLPPWAAAGRAPGVTDGRVSETTRKRPETLISSKVSLALLLTVTKKEETPRA